MWNLVIVKSLKSNVRKCFHSGQFFSTAQSARVPEDQSKKRESTIDVEDVAHHGRLSDKWWDLNGELRALHLMNPLRIQFLRDGLSNMGKIVKNGAPPPLDKIKILDVGCGGGILSEALARIGADVTGVDASSELIDIANAHAALDTSLDGRLRYVNSSVEEHSESNSEKYDAVVASEILEHVADQELFLKCCTAATKPGGSLFVTTFNKTTLSWLGGIIIAEHILNIIPRGTHDWNKFISPDETRRLLESFDCQTKLIQGMGYNPLTNSWCWTTSTAINYALHAVKK